MSEQPRLALDRITFGYAEQPVVADVLATLGQQGRGWQLALWFTSANGWVDGRRPVDLLHSEPEEVAQAAKWEAEGLVF